MKSLEELYGLEQECEEALNSKKNHSFKDLCQLAKNAGFTLDRNKKTKGGSHVYIYKHSSFQLLGNDLMNFQEDKKKKSQAKAYQVEQLVKFIREATPKQCK